MVKAMQPRIDTETIKATVDLPTLIEKDLGPGKKSGKWVLFSCPFPGHKNGDRSPSLGVTAQSWFCFTCRRHGDAIAWLMDHRGMSFQSACDFLSGGSLPLADTLPKRPEIPAYQPPELTWQQSAQQVVSHCQEALWSPAGRPALEYLHSRKLSDLFIRFYHLGWSSGFQIGELRIPRGVVIPCIEAGQIWYLKVRALPGEPCQCIACHAEMPEPGLCPKCGAKTKYLGVKGNRSSAIFGAGNLIGSEYALLVEGEMDAMIADQELRCLGVATLGSATNVPDLATWGKYLIGKKQIFAVYDNDQAGKAGAQNLARMSHRVVRLELPAGVKDINDFVLMGGDVWQWIKPHIEL